MTMQAQSPSSTFTETHIAGRQDPYLFTDVVKDSDGYHVSYQNSSGNTRGCWMSINREGKPHHYWNWAAEGTGKMKLFIVPADRDVARFWVESVLAGVNLNVMSAWAQPGGADTVEAAPVETSQQRGQAPGTGGAGPQSQSRPAYPVRSYPHYRLTSCQLVGNKHIVQYERDLASVGDDHFYVGLYNGTGQRLTWDWARGKNGTAAVETATGGAYLLYMACFFPTDPANTAFAVSRWNL
jgi:hypothetical protein